jgi:hypothetical protein
MKALGDRLESGDDRELLVWVIPNVLACAHRPLRHHPLYGGSGQPIPAAVKPLILDWIEQIRAEGIASVISFMHDQDLPCYNDIDFDGVNLNEFLERYGFCVAAIPWEDPHHKGTDPLTKRKTLERCRVAALEAFDRIPKPVLLQCSAGIDRSAPVGAHIWWKRCVALGTHSTR